MRKKASILIVSLTFISLIVCVTCHATSKSGKCAKPTLVYSEKDSDVIIKAKDDSDSIDYNARLLEGDIEGESITEKVLCSRYDNPDSTWWTVNHSGGIYEYKLCVYSDGKESSDTLYCWRVPFVDQKHPVIIFYENGKIKLLCAKEYGKKVSFFTTDDKLLGETDVKIPSVEFSIPAENKYVKVDVQHDEYTHYIVTYPLH